MTDGLSAAKEETFQVESNCANVKQPDEIIGQMSGICTSKRHPKLLKPLSVFIHTSFIYRAEDLFRFKASGSSLCKYPSSQNAVQPVTDSDTGDPYPVSESVQRQVFWSVGPRTKTNCTLPLPSIVKKK